MAYALKYERRASTASGLDFLAGVWLFVSPFVLAYQHVKLATASDVMVGMIIALLAVCRFLNPGYSRGVSWFIFLCGIWILICPVVCGFAVNQNHIPLINNVVFGLIVMLLSAISATSTARITPEMGPGTYRGE